MFKANNNEVVKNNSDKANKKFINSFKFNQLKNNEFKKLIYVLNIKAKKKLIFLTFNTKKIFNFLRLAFIKALILWHFDLKYYISIEANI